MKGILYGVGVGPGDPELLTLKAVRVIEESDVIIAPGEIPEETVAFDIARKAIPDIRNKQVVGVRMPMIKDRNVLEVSYQKAADIIRDYLDKGKRVAFLTLGDPCIYATYIYVHQRIKAAGYETKIISGIPSFLAVAATLDEGLVERSEMLHILPASYQIEEGLSMSGTKVLMKAGSKISKVKEKLKELQLEGTMVEKCGMEGERIYSNTDAIPEEASYYSIIVVKDRRGV